MPARHGGPAGSGACGVWWYEGLIDPYTKNRQLLVCPSNTTSLYGGITNYGYNNRVAANVEGLYPTRGCYAQGGQALAKLASPASTGVFGDAFGWCPWNGNGNGHWGFQPAGYDTCGASEKRHNEKCNVAFADGHVKTLGDNGLAPGGASVWTP
jgi:prepilin-type processing-associated H-X9-DG protein